MRRPSYRISTRWATVAALFCLSAGAPFLPQANAALNFTGGTHTDTATVTFNSVVQSNPTFTTTGPTSSNPAANASYTTAAPTTQSANSTVSATFDGVSNFSASLTSGASGNRPTSPGNSEIGQASSTFTFTLTTPMAYKLSGNSSGAVSGSGSSNDFTVTLSGSGLGTIASNGDVFGPFSFSGTLQAGSYTMAATIASNGLPGSTNPTITTSGNYTLAVPEPSTAGFAILGVGLLLPGWCKVARRAKTNRASAPIGS